jgi:hypothetical protein
VLAQRRQLPPMAKLLSFSNHRLMLIKNEVPRAVLKDLWPWLSNEIGLWVVYLVTEPTRFKVLARLARLAPAARRKRRWIQTHRDPHADVYAWFT